jgi:hypothetical protein
MQASDNDDYRGCRDPLVIRFSAAQHHFVSRRPGIVKAYSLLLSVPM